MQLTRKHLIILTIMVTEVLGFSLILPFLPFYAQQMGATPFGAGLLLTTFSLFQFASAPIMGRLSDVYGRRPLLIIAQISTCISFVILAAANQLWMLFLSRLVDGLLGSNGTIAQAYLSDISDKKNRSKAFGISGVAFGIGFMVGPALGGLLAQIDYSIPALLAAFISLISIALTYLFLPETVTRQAPVKEAKQTPVKAAKQATKQTAQHSKPELNLKIVDVVQLKQYWQQPQIRKQLIEFATYSGAHVLLASNFALYAKQKIQLGPGKIGLALTYIGLISIFLRGYLTPKLIDRWGEKLLERIGVVSIIVGLIGAMLVNSWQSMMLIMTFFAFGTGVVRPLMMGDISRSVNEDEQGSILGIANSINSLAQIIGPMAGGYLLTNFIPESVLLLSALIMTGGLILILQENKQY